MPKFLSTLSTSGGSPIDSSAQFNLTVPGNIAIPSGSNITIASTSSEIRVVASSGLIIIASGEGQWNYASGTQYSVLPNELDNIVFYGEASGLLNDDTESNQSGVKRWEPNYPTSGAFDTVAFSTQDTKPGLASGVRNGYNAGYYNQASGSFLLCNSFAQYFDGNDTPYTFGVVVMPEAGGVGAMGMIGCGHAATTQDLLQLGMDWASAGGQDAYSFRRDSTNTGVSATGTALIDDEPQMLIAVCSGTTISMYLNGSGIVTGASYNVGSNNLNNMIFGGTTRNGAIENPFTGHIFEVCLFSSAITDSDRIMIERHWGSKFTISTKDE